MAEHSPTATPEATPVNFAKRIRNFATVLVAVFLSVSVFLGLQTANPSSSLTALAESAIPLEAALTSNKPTLIEFYANWCTSCQAMAEDMGELKQTYGDRINFVMLNVDNSKWLPEMLHYRVDGIPQFVFLDSQSETLGSTLGEQPKAIMAANLEALLTGDALPYAQASGQTSAFEAPVTAAGGQTDPRSHGSQVVAN